MSDRAGGVMVRGRPRSVRNALARSLMEGYDETPEQMRFALDTADLVLGALRDLPVEQRMTALGMVVEYTNAAYYRGEHRKFYGVTNA